jgi:hypothetical protein
MKKIVSIISFSAALLMIAPGCEKFVEGYDVSPNAPIAVGNGLLLTGIQVGTANSFTGTLARLSAIFTQQLRGAQFQFEDYQIYVVREVDIDNEWNQIYRNMFNAQVLATQAGDANRHYRGMARVLEAMNLGLATDLWGDVPYSQALRGLQGEETFNSAYDTQEAILTDIQRLLDEAILDLADDAENLQTPGSDDLFFGGDAQKWRNIARVLKARYENRLSQRDAQGSATRALAALDAAYADGFDGNDDNLAAPFGEAELSWNQWYAFEQNREGYILADTGFIARLEDNDDPRLTEFLQPGADATGLDETALIGPYLNGATTPVDLVTYYEAKFIEAEAALRLGDAARAADAYNEAVEAAIEAAGVAAADAAAFLAANANATAGSITLEQIMEQKYIAMFGNIEAYNDWRRTGFPTLVPNPDGNVAGIPLRLPTAQSERLYNNNAEVNFDLLDPVWWDAP